MCIHARAESSHALLFMWQWITFRQANIGSAVEEGNQHWCKLIKQRMLIGKITIQYTSFDPTPLALTTRMVDSGKSRAIRAAQVFEMTWRCRPH